VGGVWFGVRRKEDAGKKENGCQGRRGEKVGADQKILSSDWGISRKRSRGKKKNQGTTQNALRERKKRSGGQKNSTRWRLMTRFPERAWGREKEGMEGQQGEWGFGGKHPELTKENAECENSTRER